MQTRQCECVYTYTGSVTDRRFVLQWAFPRRERQAKGWISFWNSNIKEAFWGRRWEESLIEGLSWWVGAGDGGGGGLQAAEAERTEWWVQYHQQDLSWIMMKSRKTAQALKEVSVSLSLPISLSFCLSSFFPLSLFAGSAEAFGNEMGFFMASLQGVSPCSGSIFGEHLELIKVQ